MKFGFTAKNRTKDVNVVALGVLSTIYIGPPLSRDRLDWEVPRMSGLQVVMGYKRDYARIYRRKI